MACQAKCAKCRARARPKCELRTWLPWVKHGKRALTVPRPYNIQCSIKVLPFCSCCFSLLFFHLFISIFLFSLACWTLANNAAKSHATTFAKRALSSQRTLWAHLLAIGCGPFFFGHLPFSFPGPFIHSLNSDYFAARVMSQQKGLRQWPN